MTNDILYMESPFHICYNIMTIIFILMFMIPKQDGIFCNIFMTPYPNTNM